MKTSLFSKASAGLIGASLFALLTGCVESGSARVGYVQTASAQPVFSDSDDYVYYPAYETYYGRRTHRYYYRDGSRWVGRSDPGRVSASVLLSAPSVNVDFHDSPDRHHAEVTRRYPHQWSNNQGRKDDRHDDRRDDNNRDDHRDDRDRK